MKKQITSAIIRYPVLVTLSIVMLFVAGYLVPRAIGVTDSGSKAENLRAAVAQASARADVAVKSPLRSPETPTVCTINGVLGTAPVGGATGTLAARLFRPGGAGGTCATPQPYPTSIAGTFVYNVHNITNTTAAALCTDRKSVV